MSVSVCLVHEFVCVVCERAFLVLVCEDECV